MNSLEKEIESLVKQQDLEYRIYAKGGRYYPQKRCGSAWVPAVSRRTEDAIAHSTREKMGMFGAVVGLLAAVPCGLLFGLGGCLVALGFGAFNAAVAFFTTGPDLRGNLDFSFNSKYDAVLELEKAKELVYDEEGNLV